MHEDSPNRPGKVMIVATPIGHLDDLSPRATRALTEADVVACEDTRHSGRLLAHIGVKKRLLSLHEHNERQRLPQLIQMLEQGLVIAVISDAGTPLISDPGFLLAREAAARGLRVEPVPGPSALLAALVVSGLPPHPFTFAGFPPPQSRKRCAFYRRFTQLEHTLVFYESPHRIVKSLADLRTELGERPVAVCRELTKLYEEVLRGSVTEIHEELAGRSSVKGELVVVVGPTVK